MAIEHVEISTRKYLRNAVAAFQMNPSATNYNLLKLAMNQYQQQFYSKEE